MFKRILVPVDGSPTSSEALATALQMARASGGQLRVLHVIDDLAYITGFEYSGNVAQLAREHAGKVLRAAQDAADAAGVPAETQLLDVPGKRLGELVAEDSRSWPADLVVVGTHGRRGVSRVLLGSGAEQVIRSASAPVLVVRGSEDATP